MQNAILNILPYSTWSVYDICLWICSYIIYSALITIIRSTHNWKTGDCCEIGKNWKWSLKSGVAYQAFQQQSLQTLKIVPLDFTECPGKHVFIFLHKLSGPSESNIWLHLPFYALFPISLIKRKLFQHLLDNTQCN